MLLVIFLRKHGGINSTRFNINYTFILKGRIFKICDLFNIREYSEELMQKLFHIIGLKYLKTLFFGFLILLNACKGDHSNSSILPSNTGNSGEILIVLPNQFRNSKLEKNIIDLLQSEQVGLPQSEPLFDLLIISPDAFKNMYLKHRNILRFTIQEKGTKATISNNQDIHAKSQQFIDIVASDERGFSNILQEKGSLIVGQFYKAELIRMQEDFKKRQSLYDKKEIEKQFGFSFTIPKEYRISKTEKDFLWLINDREEVSQGILIYSFPCADSLEPDANYIIQNRNIILRKYVPGPVKNSYMTTEMRERLYEQKVEVFENITTLEIRGLWRVEGDFMGGPFVSYSVKDKTFNHIITIEGYVFAPKFRKREYLRQLEAMLKTSEFISDQK